MKNFYFIFRELYSLSDIFKGVRLNRLWVYLL